MLEDSIQLLIVKALEKSSKRVLISQREGYRTRSITGADLLEKVNKTRAFLAEKKIKKGDRLILLGSNSIEWVTVYLASILSGIAVVPLDIFSNKALINKVQSQVKAKAVFQDKHIASSRVKTFYFDELAKYIENFSPEPHSLEAAPNDILEIVYTSGTTGDPKGVVLTHGNIGAAVNSSIRNIPLKLRMRILNLLPLSHVLGHIQGLLLLLNFGHEIFYIDTIQPSKVISLIRNKRINGAVLVPGLMAAMRRDLEGKSYARELGLQFRLIGVGGASLDNELENWWRKKFVRVVQGYGLTEASGMLTVNSLLNPKAGSVGKPADIVELKINLRGEILVKGPNVSSGYYKNEKKTKEVFFGKWLKTGDLGEMKKDYLFIRGREKDVIITESGLNVYPTDIEQILNKDKLVKESCVLEKDGKIHAVLLLKHGLAETVITRVNRKLASNQKISWPDRDFPKTPTGKVKKHLVKEKLDTLKTESYSYQNKLFNLIKHVLKPSKKITANSKLVDLGMDSLSRVELITELGHEFDTEIDEVALDQRATVSDLENLVKKRRLKRVKFRKWPLNPAINFIRSVTKNLLFFPLVAFFARLNYSGLESVNLTKGPIILASNHQSAWDAPTILKKLKIRGKIAIPAESEYVFGIGTKGKLPIKLYKKFTGIFASFFFNAYPFGETIGTDKSLEFTGEMLDRGRSILIFPEGKRTLDGKISEFKPGVGFLAVNMGVPVVPVKITGLYEVLPANKVFPKFGKVSVKFGKPIDVTDLSYLQATKLIERAVKEL